jgi:hypothetical protein
MTEARLKELEDLLAADWVDSIGIAELIAEVRRLQKQCEQAKALGPRALALGVPWADGLADGSDSGYRIGYDWGSGPESRLEPTVTDRADSETIASWPDFRDPVTESWLVAWGLQQFSHSGYRVDEMDPGVTGGMWRVLVLGTDINAFGETRAEAWILALEKLQEQG